MFSQEKKKATALGDAKAAVYNSPTRLERNTPQIKRRAKERVGRLGKK